MLHSGNSRVSLSLRAGLGAKSEAKLRKSARYPGGRRVFSRYTGIFQVYQQNTRYFADLADFGPKPASDSAQSPENLMVSPGK